jgi:hypothetical protein
MNKPQIILLSVTVFIAVIVGGIWLFLSKTHSTVPTPISNPSFFQGATDVHIPGIVQNPGTSTTTNAASANRIRVPLQNGSTFRVNDFLQNGETVPDTVNPGIYFLAGSIGYCLGNGTCPSGYATQDFAITYSTTSGEFDIAILNEPLAQNRQLAENFLMNRLGLKQFEMCGLVYFVSVSSSLNPRYAGQNLGFSFCPGAVAL